MKTECTHQIARFIFTLSALTLVSGCVITPRVEMTERIDFNYHAPAIAAPMSAVDQMCSA